MNIYTAVRISDQLDVPVIDYELQKMILPKILDMFQYILLPRPPPSSSSYSFNDNNANNSNPSRSLRLQMSPMSPMSPMSEDHSNSTHHTSTTSPTTPPPNFFLTWYQTYIGSISSSIPTTLVSMYQNSYSFFLNELNETLKQEILSLLFQTLLFGWTLGMDRPTPAMSLLRLRLIPAQYHPNHHPNHHHSTGTTGTQNFNTTVVGKKRLAVLYVFSILLPKLYDALVAYYITRDDDDHNNNNNYDNHNDNHNDEQHQHQHQRQQITLEQRGRIRRKILFRKIHEIMSKLIPMLRLINYISFLYSTASTTHKTSSTTTASTITTTTTTNVTTTTAVSNPSIPIPPPTLSMRLAGVCYANVIPLIPVFIQGLPTTTTPTTPTTSETTDTTNSITSTFHNENKSPITQQPKHVESTSNPPVAASESSASSLSSSPSSSSSSSSSSFMMAQPIVNQSINYIYAHRRLLYMELMRSLWTILPFSPSQISEWSRTISISSVKDRVQEYLLQFKRKYILQNSSTINHRTLVDTSNPQLIASIPCTICKIQPIPIPYITSCHHLYCYTCLRNAVITQEMEDWTRFKCKECGKMVRWSSPL